MTTYEFWYKKIIKAQTLDEAVKKEKLIAPKLSSIETIKDNHEELTPCIGFVTDQPEDYEDDDE